MAMTSHAEIERKYDVEDSAVLPRFDALGPVGVHSATPSEAFELVATYFDTADGALSAHRITLRRRTGGSDAGWHLKLPASTGRSELGWPVDLAGTDASPVPSAVLEPVRGIVRDHPLAPIATITTHRAITRLIGDGGAELVEIADDTVSASDVRAGILRTWREWEAELLDGAPQPEAAGARLLDAVEEVLVAAGATPAASASKLATALGRTGLGREVVEGAIDADSPSSDVLLPRVVSLVTEIVSIDASVRADEADSVHRMRTRIRRLRSLLAGYRDVFDEDATHALDDRLRMLGRVLGEARDAEVMRQRATELVDARADVPRAVRDRLVADFNGEAARTRVLAELDSDAYFRLLDAMEEFAARPVLTATASSPVQDVVPAAIRTQQKRVLKRAARAEAASSAERMALLHGTRKAAKRLRYMAEAVTEGERAVFGKKVRRIARAADAIHDILGDHRDSVRLQDHLRTAAGRSELAFAYGVLHESESRLSDALLEEYADAVRTLGRLRPR